VIYLGVNKTGFSTDLLTTSFLTIPPYYSNRFLTSAYFSFFYFNDFYDDEDSP